MYQHVQIRPCNAHTAWFIRLLDLPPEPQRQTADGRVRSIRKLTKAHASKPCLSKLSLCFSRAPRHEGVLGEWRYSSTHSSTSALNGGEWSAWHPGRFTPRERAPGTHWIGGWGGPRVVLDAMVKRKIPTSFLESNPRTPIVQPVAQSYTDCAIMAPKPYQTR
jgi:hypothetical protein